MSLIQIHLYTEQDIKYKDINIEIKEYVTFNDLFNKIEEILKEKFNINKKKIVINNNLYIIENINETFTSYLLDKEIEYNEIDDLDIICFIVLEVPELLYSDILTKCIKIINI